MDWQPDLELSDGAVTLRPYHPSDVSALFEAARESISDVYQWLPWCHPGYERIDSEEWIGNQQGFWIADSAFDFVVSDADGTFLGGCGINSISWLHRFANLGYWIRSTATGRGLATRAASLTADFGFRELGLQRLELVVEPGNSGSVRVAEKLGARREGLLRSRVHVEGEARDALMFSLVAADWSGNLSGH